MRQWISSNCQLQWNDRCVEERRRGQPSPWLEILKSLSVYQKRLLNQHSDVLCNKFLVNKGSFITLIENRQRATRYVCWQ